MQLRSTILRLTAAGTALLFGACSPEAATTPAVSRNIAAPKLSLSGGLTVFNSQLGPIIGSGTTASGHLQLKIPNDPVRNFVPGSPPIDVLISGIILNADGSALGTESGIYYSPGGLGDTFATLVAPLNIVLPPNPIRNYTFDVPATISGELAGQLLSDSHYTIRIGNLEGVLIPSGPPI